MITEITIEEFGFVALITRYKGIWRVNLTQNIVYALTGFSLKNYITFLELVEIRLANLNEQKVG